MNNYIIKSQQIKNKCRGILPSFKFPHQTSIMGWIPDILSQWAKKKFFMKISCIIERLNRQQFEVTKSESKDSLNTLSHYNFKFFRLIFSQVYHICICTMDMTYEIERRYSEFDSLYQTVNFEKNPFKIIKNWTFSDFAQLPKSGVARFPKKKNFP